jgi:hypothetical protein
VLEEAREEVSAKAESAVGGDGKEKEKENADEAEAQNVLAFLRVFLPKHDSKGHRETAAAKVLHDLYLTAQGLPITIGQLTPTTEDDDGRIELLVQFFCDEQDLPPLVLDKVTAVTRLALALRRCARADSAPHLLSKSLRADMVTLLHELGLPHKALSGFMALGSGDWEQFASIASTAGNYDPAKVQMLVKVIEQVWQLASSEIAGEQDPAGGEARGAGLAGGASAAASAAGTRVAKAAAGAAVNYTLAQLFQMIDRGRNGFIDMDEFKDLLKYFRLALTDQQAAALFARVDTDGSGSIDLDEVGTDHRNLRGAACRSPGFLTESVCAHAG